MTTTKNITLSTSISDDWTPYDKATARCHLSNYGTIVLNPRDNLPIDDTYQLMAMEKAGVIRFAERGK